MPHIPGEMLASSPADEPFSRHGIKETSVVFLVLHNDKENIRLDCYFMLITLFGYSAYVNGQARQRLD